MKKFAQYKTNNEQKGDNWYSFCKTNRIPYVIIVYRTKNSDIEFDCVTYELEIEKLLEENKEHIKDEVIKIFNKYKQKNSSINLFGPCTIKLINIDISNSENVALEIFELINNLVYCPT